MRKRTKADNPVVKGKTPEERLNALYDLHRVFFWEPYPWQQRLLEMVREKNTTAAISSNKIGKTCAVVNICISWLLGYEPWNPVDGSHPDAVEKEPGIFYRSSSLGIKPPVNIVFTAEDWKLHFGQTIVPEFYKWAPAGWFTTKKNEQGIDYLWEWHNGSKMTCMSYSQEDKLFESFRAQGAIEDEPPPQTKHTALSRGLLLDNGKTLMSLTPLKEAWILDEIVLSGRRDIGIVDGLNITDNPDLYKSDMDLLGRMGLDESQKRQFFDLLLYENKERGTPVVDRGYSAEKFLESTIKSSVNEISNLKILKFIKDIDPSDVPPRVFGQFKSLVGRILKEFDENVHIVKPFDVPTDWPAVVMIDAHMKEPHVLSYWAVNKQEIDYCIGESKIQGDGNAIADDIIRKIKRHGWNVKRAFIDPLSKGDTVAVKNLLGVEVESTYEVLFNRLSEQGIELFVASKDKESGIRNLQTALKGPNNMPTMYFFNTCEGFMYEVRRWVWDEDGKPKKENDHFCENAYRYTLVGNSYEFHKINPLPKREYVGEGSWMGA